MSGVKPAAKGPLSQRLRVARAIGTALVVLVALRTLVVTGVVVRSNSMSPTVVPGDVVLINRAAVGGRIPLLGTRVPGYSAIRRCDVVLYEHEVSSGSLFLAKRVVGVPGDTLQMKSQQLFVNHEKYPEPYATLAMGPDVGDERLSWQRHYLVGHSSATYAPTRDTWGPIVVPMNHLFVMGDRREESFDSRYTGFVPASFVRGRAVLVYFSIDPDAPHHSSVRWRRIGNTFGCQLG